MLKVVTFMKQVARGLQMEGNFGTAHVYRSSLNAIIAYRGKGDFTFHEVTPEWLKGFEIHLRGRGCSWNTVSTYLRTFRAVYNRAVDCRGAVYVPHLFRSVYTGTRADRKRALDTEDIQKVFTKLPQSSVVTSDMRRTQELFVLMFLLRGLPFVDLAYLRKSDLHDNVITYRRRKTGRPLSVTLTREAMVLLKRYMNRDSSSPYLFSLLEKNELPGRFGRNDLRWSDGLHLEISCEADGRRVWNLRAASGILSRTDRYRCGKLTYPNDNDQSD